MLYALCAVYAWGTIMADFDYNNAHSWAVLHLSSRDNVGLCAFVALEGPIGAAAGALTTNFNQHGWELWQR